MNLSFVINSILLGVGLAMDAFSVSVANGLIEPCMRRTRMFVIAGTYSFFQFAMPMLGWFFVRTAAQRFEIFQKAIPWIALILLAYIGGKMILESLREAKEKKEAPELVSETTVSGRTLLLQGVATSIDALSVGFTIAGYGALMAFIASLIIAAVTLALCLTALRLGRVFGERLAGRATIVGGLILIAIGIEIWFTNIF